MDSIDALLYMPGSFDCPKCGFHLEKRTISAATGEIGIRKDGEEGGVCPNDGTPMERTTWKDGYLAVAKSSHEVTLALIESVELQSQYAKELNAIDGSERPSFSCFGQWISYLIEWGRIPKCA